MQSKLPKRYMDELSKARAEWDQQDLRDQRAKYAPLSLKEAVAREKDGWGGKGTKTGGITGGGSAI